MDMICQPREFKAEAWARELTDRASENVGFVVRKVELSLN
jgi:hypothetical protein